MLGLVGAHRTGKTTLAEAYAKKSGATLVKMEISTLQKELGYDSSNQSYDFDTRMTIQEHLLQRFDEIYSSIKGLDAVCDRTPLDLIGYAMLAVTDDLSDAQSARLTQYVTDCVNLANERFTSLVLLQPGVPLTSSDTSAKSVLALMEKLNLIYLGAFSDERLIVPHFYIPRAMLDINSRIKACELGVKKSLERKRVNKTREIRTLGGVEFSTSIRQ
ncbi:AAA family ATPase [Acinetobacter tibetensis]|uniref:AAA family ATPase n=1 Tax=Acinetobacter tibetensis TaxID=2943497 RepID=UPI003A4E03E6